MSDLAVLEESLPGPNASRPYTQSGPLGMACPHGTVRNPFTAVPPPPSATGGTRSSRILVAHQHPAIQELRVVLQ
eukprot:7173361-Heterocapsa_arctica.AAC.1